jgi:hypothetical protein
VPGAYFVGASAHPGTGVPIAIAGSKLCAEAVLHDLDIPIPSTYGPVGPRTTARSDLDVRQRKKLLYVLEGALDSLFPYLLGAVFAISSVALWAWYTGRMVVEKDTSPDTLVGIARRYAAGAVGAAHTWIPIEVIPWIMLLAIGFLTPVIAKRIL